MKNFVEEILKGCRAILPDDIYSPFQEFVPGMEVVAKIDDDNDKDLREMIGLAMKYMEESGLNALKSAFAKSEAEHKTFIRLETISSEKAKSIIDIFMISLKDRYELWDRGNLTVGSDWSVWAPAKASVPTTEEINANLADVLKTLHRASKMSIDILKAIQEEMQDERHDQLDEDASDDEGQPYDPIKDSNTDTGEEPDIEEEPPEAGDAPPPGEETPPAEEEHLEESSETGAGETPETGDETVATEEVAAPAQ